MPSLKLVPADPAQFVCGVFPYIDRLKLLHVNDVALVAHHVLDRANVDYIFNVSNLDHRHP